MDKFIIACVLYNSEINSINSLSAFMALKNAHDNVEIVIVDNSEKEEVKKKSQSQSHDIIYLDNNGNKGLSVAYNRVLSEFLNDPCWIMLADDDTEFSIEYLENAYSKAMINSNRIFCGIVRTEQGVLSPLKANKVRKQSDLFINEPGIYNNIFCINSGLVFNISVIKETGFFEEKIFLDMLDYWFMDKLIELHMNRIEVLGGDIWQHFSGTEITDKKSQKRRFSIYKKDFSTYCHVTKKNPVYKYSTLFRRIISIYMPKWVKRRRR